MMYRIALPLLLALGLGLAACGSDGADTSAGTDPGTSAGAGSDSLTDPTTGGGGTLAPPDDSAPPVLGGGGPIGSITVTITHPEADDVSYTIGCLGDAFPVTPEVEGVTGDVACQRLADEAVLDRLVNGVPPGQVCTEIFGGPDVAVITGDIDGTAIDATVDRADGCGIEDWDNLLAGILPPAMGVTS